jgi:hypothetical protein
VLAITASGKTVEVKVAIRKGQKVRKGEIIHDPEYRLASVEGDRAWTDLATGEPRTK